ncbi:MAG: ABC transporter permease [bacterium]
MRFYEFFIALRYMTANIRQSLIISSAVGIGVSIIIFIPSINLSFFNDLIDKTVASSPHISITKEIDTFQNDIIILNKKTKENLLLIDQTQTRRRNIQSYKSILKEIVSVNGVVAAAPFASGQGIIVRGAEERGISVKGIIPEKEINITNIRNDIIKGRIENLEINDIVIGTRLAEKLNVNLGDRVTVTGPRGVSKNFKIVGIFSTGLRGSDEGQVYVNLKSAQQLLVLENEVTGIGIRVSDIYQADKIAVDLKKITGLDVNSWMDDNKQILEQIARFKIIIAFINFLIIFAAASSITSVFIMLIASKSKEIGILKSMGAKNLSIMSIFLIQAVILSVLGYLTGVAGAKLLIVWYSYILSSATETFLTTAIPVLKLNVQYALLALFYSMFTSLLASIIPAYQAARLNPVEAINA